jgi:type VI secretion system secreted protein VgrG
MSTFTFQSSALPETARIIGFFGEEGISTISCFEIYLELPKDDANAIDLDDVIGAPGKLVVSDGTSEHPYFGCIDAIEIVQAASGTAILRLELCPRLSALSRTLHAQIFTDKKVTEVLTAIFDDGGLASSDFELDLTKDYLPEEHICQYKESHFDFAARWMQREGIYFYFDHDGDAEKLILVDDKSSHRNGSTASVRYRPVAGADASAGASLSAFFARNTMASSGVRLRDYDDAKPALDVTARADAWRRSHAEVVKHGGRFFTVADAERLSKLRADEVLAAQIVFGGSGTAFGLRPGFLFDLEEHPEGDLNQSYLVLRARHSGAIGDPSLVAHLSGRSLPAGYRVEIDVLPASRQYRDTALRTWPKVHGFEHGFIDGPANDDYAQLDERGRYLVKMHFDESPLKDGKASTRIRMMQPHAGSPEGFHLPLRKGTEVVVAFLGGDPDRPVVAGFVPNADNPSPVTRANHTQNIVQTGGRTLIELEDLEGQQHVYIYTPPKDTYLFLGYPHRPATHYITAHSDGDALFNIGGEQDIDVGQKLTETVTSDVSETYLTSQTSTITGPQRTTVHSMVSETYQATQHTNVTGIRLEEFNAGQISMVGGLRDEIYQAAMTSTTLGGMTEVYSGGLTRAVTGATTEDWIGALTMVKSGFVTEMYPAGIEQKFGATTDLWQSFTWLSAPIDITTSHITVFTPANTDFKLFESNIHPMITSSKNLSNSVTGLSYGACLLSASGSGLSVSVTGISVSKALFVSSVTGLSATFGICYCDLANFILEHAF